MVIDHLETLLSWPDRQRMPNLLLLGPTNNGKSMIIVKFRRTHPPISLSDREQLPVLCVQMPRTRHPAGSTSHCSQRWEHRPDHAIGSTNSNSKH
ncbi:TniB family NTP-binding protein [Rhodococcoides fascians]